ncbi:uncharacterized protein [Ptychodera flava]|uniref:uncharacterized protein n=1 Tax=Ptychodera flava TaxID=63121 RepID=UPI00396A263F
MRSLKFTIVMLTIFGLCVGEHPSSLILKGVKAISGKIKKQFIDKVEVENGLKNVGTFNINIGNININEGPVGKTLKPHAYFTNANEYEDASEVSDEYKASVKNPTTVAPGSEGAVAVTVFFDRKVCKNTAFRYICIVYKVRGEQATSNDNDACTPFDCHQCAPGADGYCFV